MDQMTYHKQLKILTWGPSIYSARSGLFGKGPLPSGTYRILIQNVVTGSHLSSSYQDIYSGNRWFIPIDPMFNTSRSGFGIHPDGNVRGTLGCIGLDGISSQQFWSKWSNTSIATRPTFLTVFGGIGL